MALVTQTVDTSQRLAALRELMRTNVSPVDAYVVPSEDQHSSEYLAHCDERRAFISGFTGSAGCAVITTKDAYLFTDGRYFLQAEKELDGHSRRNWKLMKQGLPNVPTWQEFLHKNLETSTRIGIDPTLISAVDAESINNSLANKNSQLVPLRDNLVDQVWGNERPQRPTNKVFPLKLKYSGQSHHDKIKQVREELAKKNAKAIVVSMLDEVAWLFNLRGSDIDFNPVFFGYAVVTPNKALLFVNPDQIDEEVGQHLGSQVELRSYDSFFSYLKTLVSEYNVSKEDPILLGDKTSFAIQQAIGKDSVQIARSPVADLKSIKNPTEIEGFRQSHIRDGAALARYFAWLEEQLDNGVELNESQAADKLEEYRSQLDLYRGLSFTTISSTGPNGAIIHYSPDPNDCAIVKKDQIYLCDSGGQYLDGTTDVTRTWHFGTPTPEEKRAFTRVLQGHIAIDTAVFPNGTSGAILNDSWARRALWQDGLDYRHGTGHGVGHFLNVHEGPQGIGVRIAYNNTALKTGMTVSNEPGYYADGRFGIRIENVVVVQDAQTPNNFGDKGYLRFEHVTMCPIQKKLVDLDILTSYERDWLNRYHKETWEKVSPLIQADKRALDWLKRECSPL
ncbi:Creatinase/aminopeptidase [Neolentinus lepideus HHB14362 ss-1]|uniref:Creatinase/aminopeptidase n=1 Tax=Neolentinus lepideus HHB14362 ss-1 TaxID=1314782 RepID=A0A165RR78_9AGAM|nr:Creatinase/aminopeptidase [Neolentinus lepideus HHB14362 ss-1]